LTRRRILMDFKIKQVLRKKEVVFEVIVLVHDELELTFRLINGSPKIVSRLIHGSARLCDSERLIVPSGTFKQIVKQINGIFKKEPERRKDPQLTLF